jgi:Concanavalin A-like lectin/glucanases superfamily
MIIIGIIIVIATLLLFMRVRPCKTTQLALSTDQTQLALSTFPTSTRHTGTPSFDNISLFTPSKSNWKVMGQDNLPIYTSGGGGNMGVEYVIPPPIVFYNDVPKSLSDPLFDSVILLSHFNSAALTDYSTNLRDMVATNSYWNTSLGAFGPGCRPVGGDATLATELSSDYIIGSSNLTVEFWMYLDTLPTNYSNILRIGTATDTQQAGEHIIWYDFVSNKLRLTASYYTGATYTLNTPGVVGSADTLVAKTWYHVAYVRSSSAAGGNLRLYFNGKNSGAKSSAAGGEAFEGNRSPADNIFAFGPPPNSSLEGITALIDEVRITKHAPGQPCRYNPSPSVQFTPPPAAFADML